MEEIGKSTTKLKQRYRCSHTKRCKHPYICFSRHTFIFLLLWLDSNKQKLNKEISWGLCSASIKEGADPLAHVSWTRNKDSAGSLQLAEKSITCLLMDTDIKWYGCMGTYRCRGLSLEELTKDCKQVLSWLTSYRIVKWVLHIDRIYKTYKDKLKTD